MTKDQIKHALLSLLIGAVVSFLLTLFQGLLEFLKNHATDLVGGATATVAYLAKPFNKC